MTGAPQADGLAGPDGDRKPSASALSGSIPSALLQLAGRCEAATGPDREMDADIVQALGLAPHWVCGRIGFGQFQAPDPRDQSWSSPAFTASLDAAMTLVPEGWWIATLAQNRHGERTTVTLYNDEIEYADCRSAPTPALALCAAALRARAQQVRP